MVWGRGGVKDMPSTSIFPPSPQDLRHCWVSQDYESVDLDTHQRLIVQLVWEDDEVVQSSCLDSQTIDHNHLCGCVWSVCGGVWMYYGFFSLNERTNFSHISMFCCKTPILPQRSAVISGSLQRFLQYHIADLHLHWYMIHDTRYAISVYERDIGVFMIQDLQHWCNRDDVIFSTLMTHIRHRHVTFAKLPRVILYEFWSSVNYI